jgi:YesN/AraC family two-component response regulator
MVCNRCKAIVKCELDRSGIKHGPVELGEITISRKLTEKQQDKLLKALGKSGFELLDNKETDVIEKLKKTIALMQNEQNTNTSFTDFIIRRVNYNYSSLNNLFSDITGISIEKYIIMQKIEHVKELLPKLNINEIASKMHYRSVAQLSGQFKTLTGLTPSHFRQIINSGYN